MRIRSIKPEFWVSESIGRLSRDARLLFIGLWSFAEDSGRARGALPAVAGALFPYDRDALEHMPAWIGELEREGMVRRYTGPDGNSYIDIPNWFKHQKIEKPSKSRLPEFTEHSPNTPRNITVGNREPGAGNREQGTGSREPVPGKGTGETLPPVGGVVGGELFPTPEAEKTPEAPQPSKAQVTRALLAMAEELYALHPKKVAKQEAIKVIHRLLRDGADFADLQAKTKAYAAATAKWPRGTEQFITNPATWFRQGRYNDDQATWVRRDAEPEMPLFRRIIALKSAIDRHPANRQWVNFDERSVKPEQWDEIKALRAKMAELESQSTQNALGGAK